MSETLYGVDVVGFDLGHFTKKLWQNAHSMSTVGTDPSAAGSDTIFQGVLIQQFALMLKRATVLL